jgi:hypothetical protein
MPLRILAPTLLSAVLLAACAQPAPRDVPAAPPPGNCRAEPAQFAVGQVADTSLVEQARVRAGASRARLLRPGQAVTLEFDAARLNLEVDAGNRVLRARCG